jgi:hypothetical protein
MLASREGMWKSRCVASFILNSGTRWRDEKRLKNIWWIYHGTFWGTPLSYAWKDRGELRKHDSGSRPGRDVNRLSLKYDWYDLPLCLLALYSDSQWSSSACQSVPLWTVNKVKLSLYRHLGLQEFGAPRISRLQEGYNIVSPTHRPPLTPRRYAWYSFLLEVQSTGRVTWMKNLSDTIGNRNRDLPACSAVPQPTAPPRTPTVESKNDNF